MSTLFVTATWPHPLNEFTHGIAQRMRMLLLAAARVDPDLDLLVYGSADDCADADGVVAAQIRSDLGEHWGVWVRHVRLAPLRLVLDRCDSLWLGYLRPIFGVRWQPAMARTHGEGQTRALEQALSESRPARLFVHRLQCMHPVLAQSGALPPIVLDLDDIEHRTLSRLIELPPHWRTKRLMHWWVPTLRRFERRATRAAAVALVCSETDQTYLRSAFGLRQIEVVANALPLPVCSPLPASPTVLFLGLYSYEPNRVAAETLVHEVWPLVRRALPQAELTIAGKASQLISGFDRPPPGVKFVGFVQDLDQLYAKSRLVCCPIRSGGGTRMKIIEAALRGRPVVSTPIGAEGLSFSQAEGEISIAESPGELAAAVVELLRNDALASHMALAARAKAQALYSEGTVLAHLATLLAALAVPARR